MCRGSCGPLSALRRPLLSLLRTLGLSERSELRTALAEWILAGLEPALPGRDLSRPLCVLSERLNRALRALPEALRRALCALAKVLYRALRGVLGRGLRLLCDAAKANGVDVIIAE